MARGFAATAVEVESLAPPHRARSSAGHRRGDIHSGLVHVIIHILLLSLEILDLQHIRISIGMILAEQISGIMFS